jgi:tetratricopeptide (TPR) repeat protein
MNNETPGIYYNLAVLYRKTGLPEDAIKNLEKAIKLDPDFLSAYPLLTGLYEANGKTKK